MPGPIGGQGAVGRSGPCCAVRCTIRAPTSRSALTSWRSGSSPTAGRAAGTPRVYPTTPTTAATRTSGGRWRSARSGRVGACSTGGPSAACRPLCCIDTLREQAHGRGAVPGHGPARRASGDRAAPLIMQLPTWLWVDPAGWHPVQAQAALPGIVTVTANRAPDRPGWDPGTGGPRCACTGPGVPYDPRQPEDGQTTDCQYSYRHSSATVRRAIPPHDGPRVGGVLALRAGLRRRPLAACHHDHEPTGLGGRAPGAERSSVRLGLAVTLIARARPSLRGCNRAHGYRGRRHDQGETGPDQRDGERARIVGGDLDRAGAGGR